MSKFICHNFKNLVSALSFLSLKKVALKGTNDSAVFTSVNGTSSVLASKAKAVPFIFCINHFHFTIERFNFYFHTQRKHSDNFTFKDMFIVRVIFRQKCFKFQFETKTCCQKFICVKSYLHYKREDIIMKCFIALSTACGRLPRGKSYCWKLLKS